MIAQLQLQAEKLSSDLSMGQEQRAEQGLDPDNGAARRLSSNPLLQSIQGDLLSHAQDLLLSKHEHVVREAVFFAKAISGCALFPKVVVQQLSSQLQMGGEDHQRRALHVLSLLLFKPAPSLDLALNLLTSEHQKQRDCAMLSLMELLQNSDLVDGGAYSVLADVLLHYVTEAVVNMLDEELAAPSLSVFGRPGQPVEFRKTVFQFMSAARVFGHENVNNAVLEVSSEVCWCYVY